MKWILCCYGAFVAIENLVLRLLKALEEETISGFDIAAVLDEAWSLTKRQYWHWLLVIVVAVAIPSAIILVGVLAAMAVPALGAIVIFVGVLGFFYTILGLF